MNYEMYNIILTIVSAIMVTFFAIGMYKLTKESLRNLEERQKRSGKV